MWTCRHYLETGGACQLAELRERAVLASNQNHLDRQTAASVVRAHALEHHNATCWARRFRAAAQDRRRFAIWPVVEDTSQQIEIGAPR